MKDQDCVQFLQWALPQLRMRWAGFRKVRRQVGKRVDRRLRQLGLNGVAAYRDLLERQPSEWTVLDDLCRISISRFYRDRGVFDLLRDEVLPLLATSVRARDDHELRAWSAGCCSGEEVYTLKAVWEIAVAARFAPVALRITATDADPRLLARARRACYSAGSLKDFPRPWIPLTFDRVEDEFCVCEKFRGGIDYRLQDLRRQQPAGPFDIIFCRHLAFTYFEESLQREMLASILARLRPEGMLVIGKQESLPPGCDLREYQPHCGVYRPA